MSETPNGYWDCDCGRECHHKDGPERLPNCRAVWVEDKYYKRPVDTRISAISGRPRKKIG